MPDEPQEHPETRPVRSRKPSETPTPEPIHVIIPRIIGELPAIGKNRENKTQGFMFRGIEDVTSALKPLLAEHGVFYVPDVVERLAEKRDTRGGGIMHVIHLHVRYRFYGPAGDHLEASTWGEGSDSGDKATNKAMTSSLKYALGHVFNVADDSSDPDAHTPDETVSAGRAPGDWWTSNGWQGGSDEEIVVKTAVRDRLRKLEEPLQQQFKAWREKHELTFTQPWTRGQATAVEAQVEKLEQAPFPPSDQAHKASEPVSEPETEGDRRQAAIRIVMASPLADVVEDLKRRGLDPEGDEFDIRKRLTAALLEEAK